MLFDSETQEAIVEALSFYGNLENWSPHYKPAGSIPGQVYMPPPIKPDRGQAARDVLRKVGIDFPDELTP